MCQPGLTGRDQPPTNTDDELIGRRLDDVRLAQIMLDSLEIVDRTHAWSTARTRGRSRPTDPLRDRPVQGALNAFANFEFERLIGRVRGPLRRNRS